jgi:hypothetical protein
MKLNVDVDEGMGGACVHAPSEVIDVSISRSWDHKYVDRPWRGSVGAPLPLWLTRMEVKCRTIAVPTIEYLLTHDLTAILFDEIEYPWLDPKYAKRIARFVVLAACDILLPPVVRGQPKTGSDMKVTPRWSIAAAKLAGLSTRLRMHMHSRRAPSSSRAGPTPRLTPKDMHTVRSDALDDLEARIADVARRAKRSGNKETMQALDNFLDSAASVVDAVATYLKQCETLATRRPSIPSDPIISQVRRLVDSNSGSNSATSPRARRLNSVTHKTRKSRGSRGRSGVLGHRV